MANVHEAAQQGFTAAAASYGRGRPGYPEEIIKWLQCRVGLAPGKRVLELGAGTGKFTRYLALTGAQVHMVEPVAAMRAQLLDTVPSAFPTDGSAEAISAEDGCMDAVVCAQSFHWFATPAALSEIARVLKPHGALGLVWNIPDDRVPWVAALEALLKPLEDVAAHSYRRGTWRAIFPDPRFSPLELTSYLHSFSGPMQRVVIDRIRSLSYVANRPLHEQDRLLEQAGALLAAHLGLTPAGHLEFPYRTYAYHSMCLL